MHLTLKLETTRPAAANFLEQQGKFDDFIEVYNTKRPHQALAMACPAERYRPSPRPYCGLPELDYPLHDKAVTVTTCGRICYNRRNQSQPGLRRPDRRHQADRRSHLAGQLHGLRFRVFRR
jgi:putative transposase